MKNFLLTALMSISRFFYVILNGVFSGAGQALTMTSPDSKEKATLTKKKPEKRIDYNDVIDKYKYNR